MNPILATALAVQDECHAQGWRFFFIGAVAVLRWGEPRFTQDVDLTVVTGFGGEAKVVDGLLHRFRGRLPDARDFALRHRVVLLESDAGVPIDVALGALPFEERAAVRASDFAITPPVSLRTCSAEDLIVLKAFAARPKDWLDIEGIAVRQRGRLDVELIWTELEPLLELKEDRVTAASLRALLAAPE